METSYDSLRKTQAQERKYSSLAKLEDEYYTEYRAFLEQLRKQMKDNFSLDAAKALENSEKIFTDILEQRTQKIFFKSLRDFRNSSFDTLGLAREEKELYTKLYTLLSEHSTRLAGKTAIQTEEPKAEEQTVKVEFLVDIPEFVGVDSKNYGPYSKNQTSNMDEKQAKMLEKRSALKIIA